MPEQAPDPPDAFRYQHPIEVRYADTDALGHVNNAVYLTYFEAARAGYYRALTGEAFGTGERAREYTFVVARAEIDYDAPAYFGDALRVGCRVAWIGRSSFGLAYRIDADAGALRPARLIAHGATVQVMYDLATHRAMRVPPGLVELIEGFEGAPIPARPAR